MSSPLSTLRAVLTPTTATPETNVGAEADVDVAPPEPEPEVERAPPRGETREIPEPIFGSRDLGGSCPSCRGQMDTRLQAEYDMLGVSLYVSGWCTHCDHRFESERRRFGGTS